MTPADRYPIGATVTFADANATTSGDTGVVATGTVNGQPIEHDTPDGPVVYVPVFAQRDNGREATTVYVHEANVLSVTPPERNAR